MSFTEAIRPHIPYLRRYARILSGSQQTGDAFVRAALEAAVEGEAELDTSLEPKVALYQLFHATWSSTGEQIAEPAQDAIGERLGQVKPLARQVMVLTSVESFPIEDVATILRIDREEADRRLVESQKELEAGMATEVLIIEDEPIIALDLQAIVERMGHKVVSVARTRDEAVAKAEELKPGLVLADIQLADDSSGVDAVKEILGDGVSPPVVFITAYPERLLTGERPEPTYLITKPFMPETVSATISQALFFAGAAEAQAESSIAQ